MRRGDERSSYAVPSVVLAASSGGSGGCCAVGIRGRILSIVNPRGFLGSAIRPTRQLLEDVNRKHSVDKTFYIPALRATNASLRWEDHSLERKFLNSREDRVF